MALVITDWKVDLTAKDGELISIFAREEGIIAFILSLIGVDPITKLKIRYDTIAYENWSLSGFVNAFIDVDNLSQYQYCFFRPWRGPLVWMVLMFLCELSILYKLFDYGQGLKFGDLTSMGIFFILGLMGPLYYFLNRVLILRFIDCAGVPIQLAIKPNVLENKGFSEKDGYLLIDAFREIREARRTKLIQFTREDNKLQQLYIQFKLLEKAMEKSENLKNESKKNEIFSEMEKVKKEYENLL